MIRRFSTARRVALGAAVAVLLSGCATFQNTDTVAVVDGETISRSDIQPLVDEYFAEGNAWGTGPVVDGRADGDEMRSLIGAVVRQHVLRDFVVGEGVDIDAERTAFIAENLDADDPARALSQDMIDLLADINQGFQAKLAAKVDPPTEEEIARLYTDDPTSTGVVCMRHIQTATEAEAEDALAALSAGRDFADVVAELSTAPNTAATGGAVLDGDNQCMPITTILRALEPAFGQALLTARPGIPSDPIASGSGWHIVELRPWDEVADEVMAVMADDPVQLLMTGALLSADVQVAPKYGQWNPAIGAVEPIG